MTAFYGRGPSGLADQGTRGRFIVFEGLDGAGTTTQIAGLAQWLTARGQYVETTREPSSGPFGAILRQAVERRVVLDPVTLALAFAADRSDHVNNPVNGVRKALDQGSWVLCDRYLFSSLAYQASEDLDIDWLLELNRFAIAPDLTIFIDTRVDVCLDRIGSRSENEELFHDERLLRKVLRNYRRVIAAGRLTGTLVTVDGNGTADVVANSVAAEVARWVQRVDGRIASGWSTATGRPSLTSIWNAPDS